MQRLADALDQVNIWTGKTVRWFALLMVLLQFTVVLLRCFRVQFNRAK